MAAGTIVRVWQDGTKAYAAVRVTENWGPTEYIGSVPLTEIPQGATNAQKKTLLEAAVRAERTRALAVVAPTEQAIGGISGSVEV
jgi:hypothetical protein